jgi:putative SOS response-associated peptidase YedK
MCNLYSMTRNREAILRLFRVSHNRTTAFEPLSAIFPGYQAPIVRKAPDGERELVNLNCGFVLLQKDRAPRRVTNVRDDKILTSQRRGSPKVAYYSCGEWEEELQEEAHHALKST